MFAPRAAGSVAKGKTSGQDVAMGRNSGSAFGLAAIGLAALAVAGFFGWKAFRDWEEAGPARAAAELINAARLSDLPTISARFDAERLRASLEGQLREAASAAPTPAAVAAQTGDQVTAAFQSAAEAVGEFMAGLAGAAQTAEPTTAPMPAAPARPAWDPQTRAAELVEPKALAGLTLKALAYAGVDAPRDRKDLTKFLTARTDRLDETHAEITLTPDLVGALVVSRVTVLKMERRGMTDWRLVGMDLPPDAGPALP